MIISDNFYTYPCFTSVIFVLTFVFTQLFTPLHYTLFRSSSVIPPARKGQ